MITFGVVALAFSAAQQAPRPAPPPPPLRASMVSLGVADMDRSIVFYRDILGLELRGEPGEVTLIDAGAFAIALNRPLGAASNIIVGATEIVFQVDSVTEAWQRLLERGCKFATPVREIFSGTWAATFTDPDGHRLTIMGPP